MIALSLSTVLAACSGTSYKVVPVSGRITLDGQALPDATITFQPVSTAESKGNPGSGSFGKTDADGKFTLRLLDPDKPGAAVGVHVVRITTSTSTNPKDDSRSAITAERVPASFRDGSQQFTVPPAGTDKADFALTTASS